MFKILWILLCITYFTWVMYKIRRNCIECLTFHRQSIKLIDLDNIIDIYLMIQAQRAGTLELSLDMFEVLGGCEAKRSFRRYILRKLRSGLILREQRNAIETEWNQCSIIISITYWQEVVTHFSKIGQTQARPLAHIIPA